MKSNSSWKLCLAHMIWLFHWRSMKEVETKCLQVIACKIWIKYSMNTSTWSFKTHLICEQSHWRNWDSWTGHFPQANGNSNCFNLISLPRMIRCFHYLQQRTNCKLQFSIIYFHHPGMFSTSNWEWSTGKKSIFNLVGYNLFSHEKMYFECNTTVMHPFAPISFFFFKINIYIKNKRRKLVIHYQVLWLYWMSHFINWTAPWKTQVPGQGFRTLSCRETQ